MCPILSNVHDFHKPFGEQKVDLRQYKKKLKVQEVQIEAVPLTIEEDLSQNDRPKPIEAL